MAIRVEAKSALIREPVLFCAGLRHAWESGAMLAGPLFNCDLISGAMQVSIATMPAAGSKQPSIKSAAARMVRDLAASASWDDLMYQIVARQKIERGLADIKAGRSHPHDEVLKQFGLSK